MTSKTSNDLANYHSLQDRIEVLEAELLAMTKQHVKEIKTLKRATQRARLETQRALLTDKRPEWALRLIKERNEGKDITLKDIAKECRMAYKRVLVIFNEVRDGTR